MGVLSAVMWLIVAVVTLWAVAVLSVIWMAVFILRGLVYDDCGFCGCALCEEEDFLSEGDKNLAG